MEKRKVCKATLAAELITGVIGLMSDDVEVQNKCILWMKFLDGLNRKCIGGGSDVYEIPRSAEGRKQRDASH